MREENDARCRGRSRGGAQTFRRGRALLFYQQLETKRATLKAQLESTELQAIHQMIAGELKATEAIMNEFKVMFHLDELAAEQHKQKD